jgi:hypothetical protein
LIYLVSPASTIKYVATEKNEWLRQKLI